MSSYVIETNPNGAEPYTSSVSQKQHARERAARVANERQETVRIFNKKTGYEEFIEPVLKELVG